MMILMRQLSMNSGVDYVHQMLHGSGKCGVDPLPQK